MFTLRGFNQNVAAWRSDGASGTQERTRALFGGRALADGAHEHRPRYALGAVEAMVASTPNEEDVTTAEGMEALLIRTPYEHGGAGTGQPRSLDGRHQFHVRCSRLPWRRWIRDDKENFMQRAAAISRGSKASLATTPWRVCSTTISKMVGRFCHVAGETHAGTRHQQEVISGDEFATCSGK